MAETPDYRQLNAISLAYPVTDLGEIAARLGSIDTFDRRGDVVLLHSFESGLGRFLAQLSGTGAAVDLSLTSPRSGQFSCRLVAGSTSQQRAGVATSVPVPPSSLIGLEASFVYLSVDTSAIRLQMVHQNQSRNYEYGLRWLRASQVLQVYNSSGAWVSVASGVPVGGGAGIFGTLKLVIDLANIRYVRGLLNRFAVDLSAYTPQDNGATAVDNLAVGAHHDGTTGNPVAHVDDIIVTQNEPQ
jgi:hypothetical protein